MFVCLFGFLTSSSTTRLYRGRAPRQERLTILRAATHETELGDHDFCLSRSHYTDTDPTCRERAATAGIEPGTSSPRVARSTAELPRPPLATLNGITHWKNYSWRAHVRVGGAEGDPEGDGRRTLANGWESRLWRLEDKHLREGSSVRQFGRPRPLRIRHRRRKK